ncbi:MAG: RDD family protein, partial [Candidatus Thermoplasmatota archaeon]|nr:RDD family protein [Candidatus Thermoplasmatota archaeon]
YGEEATLDFDLYPKTEIYEIKRAIAYLIDQIFAFIIVILFSLLLKGGDLSFVTWIIIIVLSGGLNVLIKVIGEGMMGSSIGKAFLGLRVVDAHGQVTVGESLTRNILCVVPILLPVLDYMIGQGSSDDKRQKFTDSLSGTLVVEDLPPEPEEPRPRYKQIRVEPSPPKEKVMLGYRNVRRGNCPNCGAPYRVVDADDKTFSGLWNYRCTWCNHLITEEANRFGKRRS